MEQDRTWLGGTSGIYTVVRLDLVESLLRRGVRGISLKEAAVTGGGA